MGDVRLTVSLTLYLDERLIPFTPGLKEEGLDDVTQDTPSHLAYKVCPPKFSSYSTGGPNRTPRTGTVNERVSEPKRQNTPHVIFEGAHTTRLHSSLGSLGP